MKEFIEFFGVVCAVYLFVEGAKLIQFIKELFDMHNEAKRPRPIWKRMLWELINCNMCSGFWFGMIYYGLIKFDSYFFIYACITSISAEVFSLAYKWVTIRLQYFKK